MEKLNYSEVFELNVTEDELYAYVKIHRPEVRDIRLIDIQKYLLQENLVIGVQLENVKDFLKYERYEEEFLVSKGFPPGETEDASLDYLVSDEVEQNLEEDDEGKVDFKSIEIVKMIDKGTPLIRKNPISLGSEGSNVFNIIIPPEEGEDIDIPIGENNEISPMDENLCIASCDGFITKRTDGKVDVKPILRVREDIDFSTGNINFKGSVIIPGDVKSGFKVEATKDIVIHGAVENAEVFAEGNITIKGGFIGKREGHIKAIGDVRISHVENQMVEAEGSVFIKTELLNAEIKAGNSVFIEKGKIIGGNISAGSKIDAFDIGTKEGTHTEVIVGKNSFIIDKMVEIENEINGLEERLKNITSEIAELAMKKVNKKSFTDEMGERLARLRKEKEQIPEIIEDRKSEISHVEGDLKKLLESKIIVRGNLYANVKLSVSEKSLLTREDSHNVNVYLDEDMIRIEKR